VTSHLLPVFARIDLAFERGEGCWLVATNGERYLDFGTGIAVNSLGHSHPHLVAKLTEQVGKLWHISNLYKMPDGERLAARLCEASFADTVFSPTPAPRLTSAPSRSGANIMRRTARPSAIGW